MPRTMPKFATVYFEAYVRPYQLFCLASSTSLPFDKPCLTLACRHKGVGDLIRLREQDLCSLLGLYRLNK